MKHASRRFNSTVTVLSFSGLLVGCCPEPKPCPTVPPCPEPPKPPKQCETKQVKVTFNDPPKFVPPCAVAEPNLNGHPAISFSHTLRTGEYGRSVEAVVSVMAMNGEGYAAGIQTTKVFTLSEQDLNDGWRISEVDTVPDHFKTRMSAQTQSVTPPGANLKSLQLYGDTADNECGTFTGASWSYKETGLTLVRNDGTCLMPTPP